MKIGLPHLIGIGLACVILIGAGFVLANMRQRMQPTSIEIISPPLTATPPPSPSPEPTPTTGPFNVYVSGAVVHPAVYRLPPGSIIDDAVRAAGGFAADADTVAVNLAQPIFDGLQIYVPVLGEIAATPPPVSAPPVVDTPGSRMGGITIGGLININIANQADLEMLPGIGPATAANIIAHREANGPFATIEEIMDVPGIGEGKFATIKELITIGP